MLKMNKIINWQLKQTHIQENPNDVRRSQRKIARHTHKHVWALDNVLADDGLYWHCWHNSESSILLGWIVIVIRHVKWHVGIGGWETFCEMETGDDSYRISKIQLFFDFPYVRETWATWRWTVETQWNDRIWRIRSFYSSEMITIFGWLSNDVQHPHHGSHRLRLAANTHIW